MRLNSVRSGQEAAFGSRKLKIFGQEPDKRFAVNPFGGRGTDRSGSSAHHSPLLKKNGVRTADGQRAYVLALARIRFRGARDSVHRNRPRGVPRVEHLTRLASP